MKISFIIPTRNNLTYLIQAYESIRNYYKEHEIIILDDNSSDGTKEWLKESIITDPNLIMFISNEDKQIGHTILYDTGVELMTNEIFTIFHADMQCGPNYIENLIKHWKPKTVVSATRIEPPLHPPGAEKITKDFGIYPNEFKKEEFTLFCIEKQKEFNNQTTRGIFAPWLMSKIDFQSVGGHDRLYAPFPYEDSDIFQRFILAGYNIIQSRDSFVYHYTARGHRWTKEVQKDDTFYKLCCAKNMAHYLRKWGSWIENDENCYPVIQNKYDIGFVVNNCTPNLLGMLEPWCSTLYTDLDVKLFIDNLQPGTPFDMTKRVKKLTDEKTNQILLTFDSKKLTQQNFGIITSLAKIIKDSGEVGTFEHDIFSFEIKGLDTFQDKLVNNADEYYTKQLKEIDVADPYCLNTLFEIYEKVKKSV